MELKIIDWLIISLVPIAALIASEIFKRRFPNAISRRGFTLANQQLGGVAVASTYIGANITFTSIFIILSQEGYKRGNVAFVVPIFWFIGTLFFLLLYPRIKEYIINGMTLHQTIGKVFQSNSLKFYASLWTIMAFTLTVALEFYGGIKLISVANVPLLSYLLIGLIFIVIVGIFTARGGFGGVAYADIVLDLITFAGIAVLTSGLLSFIVNLVGNNFSNIYSTNQQIPNYPSNTENLIFSLSMFVLMVPFQFCTFDSWQRLSARKNREKSPNTLIFFSGLAVSLIFCIPIFLGIYLRNENVFVDIKNNGLVLFEFLKYHIYPTISLGVVFAGFIAAIFTTADELLNCCSYSFLSDALEVDNTKNDKDVLNYSYKFYVIIFSIISALLALLGLWKEREITEIGIAVFSTQIVFILPLFFVFFKKEDANKYVKRVKWSMILSIISVFVFVISGWIVDDRTLVEGAPLAALLIEIATFSVLSIFRKKEIVI